jgi:hypothetical protein
MQYLLPILLVDPRVQLSERPQGVYVDSASKWCLKNLWVFHFLQPLGPGVAVTRNLGLVLFEYSGCVFLRGKRSSGMNHK